MTRSPKLFDPARVVTTSEPFDVDEFIRGIREGRDVRREWPGVIVPDTSVVSLVFKGDSLVMTSTCPT